MPEPLVVDASAWLAVIFREEGYEAIRPFVERADWWAPEWIVVEVANAITKKATFSNAERIEMIGAISASSFKRLDTSIWLNDAARLAVEYEDLSFYDAVYIASAATLRASLLTLDPVIKEIMKKEGVRPVIL